MCYISNVVLLLIAISAITAITEQLHHHESNRPIHTGTPDTTQQDRLVVSGGRFELGMEVTGMGWGREPYLVPVQLSTGNCERSANAIELHFVVVHVKMN